jgi:hypothetical protein
MLRSAAQRAGLITELDSDLLDFCSEPEASALQCVSRDTRNVRVYFVCTDYICVVLRSRACRPEGEQIPECLRERSAYLLLLICSVCLTGYSSLRQATYSP